MSVLPERLISAANEAYQKSEDGPGYLDFTCRVSISAAVVAVLRELAQELPAQPTSKYASEFIRQTERMAHRTLATRFDQWADEIEGAS